MLWDLEYDKGENARLRADINYMLEIDTTTYNKKTLFEHILTLAFLKQRKSSRKFRHNKFKHIRNAISLNDDDYLYSAVYNNYSIFTLRQNTADTRYELRDLLNHPNSELAAGLIVDEFDIIEKQWKDLKDIAEEIKSYLEHKYYKEIKLTK